MSIRRLDLTLEATVVATDGPCGSVQQLIVNPHDGRITALAVQPYMPFAYPVLIPLERVAATGDDTVQLTMNSAAVAELPFYDVEQPTTPPVLVLHAGMRVLCSDGEAGHVTLLLANPRGQVRHFVLRAAPPEGRKVIVPVDWVREVDQNNVHLLVARGALEGQPDYRLDREIAGEVERALWDDDVLRETAYYQTDVVVIAGTAILRGHVHTSTIKERVEFAVRGVRGVLEVDNHLVADEELVNEVARALGDDSRLCGQLVHVQAHQGFITLTGAVRDADARTAAGAAAAGVSQVRGVINHVTAPGVNINVEAQRAVQPRIGQEVFATDGSLGHVERVLINPRNRLVTAIVVHGWFPDARRLHPHTFSEMPAQEQHVVVPIDDVRLVTVGGVWLSVSSLDVAHDKALDTACFIAPEAGWQPPYPYSHAEVLLDPD